MFLYVSATTHITSVVLQFGNLVLGTKETLALLRGAGCALVHESMYKHVSMQAAAS